MNHLKYLKKTWIQGIIITQIKESNIMDSWNKIKINIINKER
jgi:hypothetical protein